MTDVGAAPTPTTAAIGTVQAEPLGTGPLRADGSMVYVMDKQGKIVYKAMWTDYADIETVLENLLMWRDTGRKSVRRYWSGQAPRRGTIYRPPSAATSRVSD
jgi:hypothetical protein